ncbi:hypothetical protein K9U40_09235 [Xanthobacter autotrophicus]|uniref:hypothetical protein n=1 Tax=Xanthobacter TaxID=279 RepID=UPI0024AC7A51|nr:hypothetical protein [Xanthobacter autotrophicus]MDI4664506.1 hypothetical protein [Xanthobacter autotrophicus]
MTAIENTPLGRLDKEGRLLNAVLKQATKPGRFDFRGDIALKFQQQVADEKRPPEYTMEQVITFAEEGKPTIPVLAGYLQNFAFLSDVADVLGDALAPDGKYFLFCNNIDLLAKYRVTYGDKTFYVLPCDESTVWKEMMDLLSLDKNDIKKLDTGGKTDVVLDAALGWHEDYETITYEKGVSIMEPVKNRNENRPV